MAEQQLVSVICELMREKRILEFEKDEPCDIDRALDYAYWEGRLDLVEVLLRNGGKQEVLDQAIADKKAFEAWHVVE